ncbi:hypothetical protein BDV12DRAFT_56588 [Aspergillus spectabilis]
MPDKQPRQDIAKPRKIRRVHSGCRPCRKRGKKCDETKPCCLACARLRLECGYGVNFAFQNLDSQSYQQKPTIQISKSPVACCSTKGHERALVRARPRPHAPLVSPLNSEANLETRYLDHFMRHVHHLIPAASLLFTERFLQSPHLRAAVLCISASNISMLNTQVQSRNLSTNSRKSLFSPLPNYTHQTHAHEYHNRALCHYTNTNTHTPDSNAPTLLTTLTLLAYYHHASTSHLNFRHAVWATLQFVAQNRDTLSQSPEGTAALQMWYRVCISHRLSKPPTLLLEGEGISSFGPNRYPDSFEHVYLSCILGMSSDDLIYDILIKSIEIRSRVVVFRAVAGKYVVSEINRGIGCVAHDLLTKMLGKEDLEEERAEAEKGFMRGAHLLGLLDVQKGRLGVWKSRLNEDQLPDSLSFPTHRDAMNALYSLLCEMMFSECQHHSTPPTTTTTPAPLHTLANSALHIITTLNYTHSATKDIYTFSLTEVLLQFTLIYKSATTSSYILDDLWPQLESKARGYEHSHYPTHLVKRIITLLAELWGSGSDVTFALPAVGEDVAKVKLLDIYSPVEVVICGRRFQGVGEKREGGWFVDKVILS